MNELTESNPLRDRLRLQPNWSEALEALQGHKQSGIRWEYNGKHDAKPLAELLRGSEPIPQAVREILSRLLVPRKGHIGGKLIYKKPGPRAIELQKRLRKEIDAKQYIYELMHEGEPTMKFDAAVEEAAEKFRMSKSWARNLKTLTPKMVFSKLSAVFDEATLQP